MPAQLKALRGSEGGKATATVEAVDYPCPECPEWLSDDGKQEWARLAPALHALGRLTPEDVAAFAAYCQSVAMFKLATEQVRKDGLMVEGSQGQKRTHPAVQAADNALKQIHRFALEFGFTPSSRHRFALPVLNDEKEEFDSF